MNKFSDVELTDSAKEAVLFANTPSYLLERLRKDSAVQILQHGCAPGCLFEMLSESGPTKDALDVVRKYLLLVAITTSNWPDRWENLSKLDLSDLEWGDTLLELMRAESIPTQTINVVGETRDAKPKAFYWNQLVG
jgi:hypothetical protein